MAVVQKSVLVGYSAQRMYALVDEVERYPEFLPWCGGTELEHRDGEVTRASIQIDYRGIRQTFKTENRTQAPELIQIRLVSGPFHTLDGTWRFTALAPGLPYRFPVAL
jgi:ribosome-associated toxin RatA of RatAB toxin-antitoxin module